MGICVSCDSASDPTTGKLIFPDGELIQFSTTIRAADVLKNDPNVFIVDADDMEFDGVVTPLDADERLRQGQIYFVLPRTLMKKRMKTEDMAALAAKASAAMVRAAAGETRRRRRGGAVVAPMDFDRGFDGEVEVKAATARRKRRDGGRRRKFEPELSAIPE